MMHGRITVKLNKFLPAAISCKLALYSVIFSFFPGCVVFDILLIPFERELQWGGAIVEITKLTLPGPSAEASYGVIDRNGKFIVPMQGDWISPYREGLSASARCNNKIQECKYGFRDKDLNWVIPAKFDKRPGDFSDGYAMYPRRPYAFGEKYRFLDKSGKFALGGQGFDEALDFQYGYARVALKQLGENEKKAKTYKWGWLDKSGKVYDFDEPATTFIDQQNSHSVVREGMFPCPSVDSEGQLKWGFKNPKGEWVVTAKYYSLRPYYFGKAFVQVERGIEYNIFVLDQFHLIDMKGERVFPNSVFQSVEPPNHRGLGILTYVPEPGEKSAKQFLYNWKSGKRSDFAIHSATSRDVFWEDKWFNAGEWTRDPDGTTRFRTIYYDENFQAVLSQTKEGYRILRGESFSEDAAYVEFYRVNDSKMETKKGIMDRSGKILFYFDRNFQGSIPPFVSSNRLLLYNVK